jgi:hypothetical protein
MFGEQKKWSLVALGLIVTILSLGILISGLVSAQDDSTPEATINALATQNANLEVTISALQTAVATPFKFYCFFCINIIDDGNIDLGISTVVPTQTILTPTPTVMSLVYEHSFEESDETWILEANSIIENGVLSIVATDSMNIIEVPVDISTPFSLIVDIRLVSGNNGDLLPNALIIYGDTDNREYVYLELHTEFIDVYQVRGDSEQFMQTLAVENVDWSVFQSIEVNFRSTQISVSLDNELLGIVQADVIGSQLAFAALSEDAIGGSIQIDNLQLGRLDQ